MRTLGAVDGSVAIGVEAVERAAQGDVRVLIHRPDGSAELVKGDDAILERVGRCHCPLRLPLGGPQRPHHTLELVEVNRAVAVGVVPTASAMRAVGAWGGAGRRVGRDTWAGSARLAAV